MAVAKSAPKFNFQSFKTYSESVQDPMTSEELSKEATISAVAKSAPKFGFKPCSDSVPMASEEQNNDETISAVTKPAPKFKFQKFN